MPRTEHEANIALAATMGLTNDEREAEAMLEYWQAQAAVKALVYGKRKGVSSPIQSCNV